MSMASRSQQCRQSPSRQAQARRSRRPPSPGSPSTSLQGVRSRSMCMSMSQPWPTWQRPRAPRSPSPLTTMRASRQLTRREMSTATLAPQTSTAMTPAAAVPLWPASRARASRRRTRSLARVTLSAGAAGDVSWAKMQFTLNKTAALTLGATTTVAVWNSASQITGTIGTSTLSSVALTQTCAVAGETTCVITFLPTTEQTILAGQSETYELRGTVGGTAAGNNSIDVSIQRPSTTVSTGTFSQIGNTAATTTSFVWSDRSAWGVTHSTGSPDWSNEYLIRSGNYATGATLPITIGTQSVSINT